jgi:hypothetical protein
MKYIYIYVTNHHVKQSTKNHHAHTKVNGGFGKEKSQKEDKWKNAVHIDRSLFTGINFLGSHVGWNKSFTDLLEMRIIKE